jgi:beta-mannosidase
LPSTATGPRFNADSKDFGKGLHWNVHGPWKPWDDLTGWNEYWAGDDALFRAESGAPGACDPEIIRRYAGDLDPMPVSVRNPLWRRPMTWWIEAEQFEAERGRPAVTLEEYVEWSQERQAKALTTLVSACKSRFPMCGGVLLWCGHDCFPCPANTSILDYDLNPKPAALALQRLWRDSEM